MWPRNRSVICLCASRPLNLSTHPAMFRGHRPCGWENMTFWNCPVTTGSKYHMTFSGGASTSWASTLPNFGDHGPCECGVITFFIFHLSTWMMCHEILWVGPLILNHHPAKFGAHGTCESEDITFFCLSRDHDIDVWRDILGGVPLS